MSATEERTTDLLERIAKLLTILVTRGLPSGDATQKEQIILLSSAGLRPKEIAEMVGTKPHTVSVTLSDAKKRGGSGPTRPTQEERRERHE